MLKYPLIYTQMKPGKWYAQIDMLRLLGEFEMPGSARIIMRQLARRHWLCDLDTTDDNNWQIRRKK